MPATPRWSAPWASCPQGAVTLVETRGRRRSARAADPDNLAFVTQTTLSVDDTREIVAALQARFPAIAAPHKEDICYATTNRQEAVKRVAPLVDRADRGRRAQLVQLAAPARGRRAGRLRRSRGWSQRAADIDWALFGGIARARHHRRRLGAGGAGRGVIDAFAERYDVTSRRVSTADESVFFPLPRELRDDSGRLSGVAAGRWPSTPKSPTRSSRASSPATTSARSLSFKGIAEGVENSNFLLHTERGLYILTLYEKRVTRGGPAVLPRPDGASGRPAASPARAGARPRRARRSAGSPAGRPRSSPSSTACRSRRPGAAPLPRGRARRWRGCTWPGADFAMRRAPTPCRSRAGGRCSSRRATRADAVAPGLAPRSTRELDDARARLADRTCRRASSTPTSSPTTCSSSASRLSGPHRLLLRLQRRPRLRRRGLPQRLVLRARRRLQPHQGRGRCSRGYERVRPLTAAEIDGAAAARARRGAALPADPPRRLAERAARRAGEAQGPARISTASCASTARVEPAARLWPRSA